MRSLSVTAALAIAAAIALPSTAGAVPPTEDSVTGSGVWEQQPGRLFAFEFDAHSDANGEHATGFVVFDGPSVGFTAEVTCLAVQDNVARLNFVIVEDPSLGVLRLRVIDNARSGAPDIIETFGTGDSPSDCSVPGQPFSSGPVTSGDLVVVDAATGPTTTEQCKKGGWRSFGIFNNQGDCVSFVATKGKNPPSGP
jgi:hypothetical protein